MDYEYALLEKQRIDMLIAHGVEITVQIQTHRWQREIKRWRVLRQGRVTAGRTVIRETMSPNGVEDIGSERCVKDFDNLFTVFQPY